MRLPYNRTILSNRTEIHGQSNYEPKGFKTLTTNKINVGKHVKAMVEFKSQVHDTIIWQPSIVYT